MRLIPVLALAAAPALATSTADLLQGLQGANTAVERIAVLADDSDFVFNFLDPANKATKGAGGKAVASSVGNFPALFGSGLAMTLGFMEPCSMNSPHTHPRATEALVLINGTIEVGFLAENGARFVMNTVNALEATVFPRGSIHFQANLGCEPVLFAATLNNEDPGTLQIAQRFFALPADVVGAALGGVGVQEVSGLAKYIPDNLIDAADACFTACGLTPPAKGSQPTSQQQSAAASPSPTTTSTSGSSSASTDSFKDKGTPNNWIGLGDSSVDDVDASLYSSNPNPPNAGSGLKDSSKNFADANAAAGSSAAASSRLPGWFAHLDGTKIALIALAAVNVAAVLGALVFLGIRAHKRRTLAKNGGMDTMPITTGRNIGGPRPLLAGGPPLSRGGYAAAEFELPLDDAASGETVLPRKYEDPYDKPPSRAPSPLPPAHSGPYRD